MKRVFFLVVSLVLFASTLTGQTKDREFGVVVFYTTGYPTNKNLSLNNINVITLNRGILYHKIYSYGNALFSASASSISENLNIPLTLNDTIFVRIHTNTTGELRLKIIDKNPAVNEIESEKKDKGFYSALYSSERITYPYIPESFEDDKNTGKRSASGFLLSNDGFIITNYHVIENTKNVTVRGVNGNKKSSLSASVIYTDSTNDLAILKLDDKITINTPVYTLRNTACEIGESIFVLGYPLTNAMGEDIKLTDGLVSSQNGYKGDTTSYQISAPVQPGNSGAPLFDKNGAVVGVINAKLSGAENATYAIKLTHVLAAMQKAGVKQPAAANSLSGKPLTQQVKAIQDFVYIVEAE